MDKFNPNFNDTKELVKLFGDEAKRVSKLLNNGNSYDAHISTTQFRQFYEKILELNDKAQGLNEADFKIKILPFVKLLNSKVQYSFSRRNCKQNFVDMMKKSIDKVESSIELQNFKYFLEAIIGYMPKK